MKKQINPTIKAHLVRSAFYLLLLLGVCAIPFALAQRAATKQSMTKPSVAKQGAAANVAQVPVDARSAPALASTQRAGYAQLATRFNVDGSVRAPAAKQVPFDAQTFSQVGNARPTGTTTLWYNGDFNGVNGLANEENTSIGSGEFASVYDDFNVPSGPGWNVTAVFSDNLASTNVTGATWEIRQGITEGNGGTLIASGMTMTPVVTPTGRSGFGFTEYMVEVTGLNVSLASGTYFLNVTVVGDLTGRSFDSNTSGANCVGTPCGNNQNAFFNSNFFGANFTSTANEGQPTDFSMGVIGSLGGPTPTASPTPTPTPTASPSCTPGWQMEPPLLTARVFASGAVANSVFYVLTGFDGSSSYVTATDFFNGSTWAKGAPIPMPHSQSHAAAVGTNIYVPGGYNFGPINNMQIYDTVGNSWSSGMTLPDVRSGPAVAAFNGKVYIIGGFAANFAQQNQVWEYDPVANTYTTKTPMPGAAGNVPGTVLGNEIFVIGGSSGFGTANFAYNPATDTWRTITPPSPPDCQAGSLFALNGQLWLVGCLGQNGTIAKVYDPNSDSWSTGPSLLTSQEGGSASGLFNATAFVAGGASGGGASTTVESVVTCGTPTPTPTATATATPTATLAPRETPTPRPRPTPVPRP